MGDAKYNAYPCGQELHDLLDGVSPKVQKERIRKWLKTPVAAEVLQGRGGEPPRNPYRNATHTVENWLKGTMPSEKFEPLLLALFNYESRTRLEAERATLRLLKGTELPLEIREALARFNISGPARAILGRFHAENELKRRFEELDPIARTVACKLWGEAVHGTLVVDQTLAWLLDLLDKSKADAESAKP